MIKINKITVTKLQMEAIERQKVISDMKLKHALGHAREKNFCEGSEPINNMTTEQIVLAWHGYVEIEKEYATFDEAMKAHDDGSLVSFHPKEGSKITGMLRCKLKENWFGNYTLNELRNGKWSIEGVINLVST